MLEWEINGRRIVIREVVGDDEMHVVEEIQREAWGFSDLDVVPAAQLVAAQHVGGMVLGAFDGDRMIGFVYGFPGYEHDQISIHSHMLAVRPEYRGLRAGLFLKLAQREVALERGVKEITWTFDPLQSLNANLNFSTLGVISHRYIVNFYGEATSSPLHQGFGTDRLWVSWFLDSERVRNRVTRTREGRPVSVPDEAVLWAPRLVEQQVEGVVVKDLSDNLSDTCLIEIPGNISEVKKRDPALGPVWREATRRAFLQALDSGFVVSDFLRLETETQRWFYLLTRRPF